MSVLEALDNLLKASGQVASINFTDGGGTSTVSLLGSLSIREATEDERLLYSSEERALQDVEEEFRELHKESQVQDILQSVYKIAEYCGIQEYQDYVTNLQQKQVNLAIKKQQALKSIEAKKDHIAQKKQQQHHQAQELEILSVETTNLEQQRQRRRTLKNPLLESASQQAESLENHDDDDDGDGGGGDGDLEALEAEYRDLEASLHIIPPSSNESDMNSTVMTKLHAQYQALKEQLHLGVLTRTVERRLITNAASTVIPDSGDQELSEDMTSTTSKGGGEQWPNFQLRPSAVITAKVLSLIFDWNQGNNYQGKRIPLSELKEQFQQTLKAKDGINPEISMRTLYLLVGNKLVTIDRKERSALVYYNFDFTL